MFRLTLILYIAYSILSVNGDIIVNLPKGQVAGVESVTDTCTIYDLDCVEFSYYSFRGMRYAEKPNRFERALPVSPWSGVYDAKKDRAICIQTPPSESLSESEDCLFINVYTPKLPDPNSDNLTVMFWIHGGGFILKDALNTQYGPDYFVALQNVVIVTINYRLGALGFLSDGTSRVPGNFAIHDMVLGLQWIQENIAYFGGDPRKVTLFGQSAGAAICSYLILSPLTRNKSDPRKVTLFGQSAGAAICSYLILSPLTRNKKYFRNSILQSGSALNPWSLQRHPEQIYKKVIAALGCSTPFSSSGSQLACAKSAPIANIRLATTATSVLGIVIDFDFFNGIPFAPVLEEPSEFAAITLNTYKALKSGNFPRDIDLLMGGTSEESLFIATELESLRPLFLQMDLNHSLLVPEDMYVTNRNDLQNQVIPTIYSFYFGNKSVTLSPIQNILKYCSGTLFNKSWREYFTLVGNSTKAYCYYLTYNGTMGGNFQTIPGVGEVGHAADLHYLWRDDYSKNRTFPQHDYLVRKRMLTAWTNFAITGNPTPIKDPLLQNLTWPQASLGASNIECMEIDYDLKVIENPKEQEYQMWRKLYKDYGNPKNTY